jgi:hypothetical protein
MAAPKELEKPKLPDYKFDPLGEGKDLRLLRLRPSSDDNNDIDVELADFSFPDHHSTEVNPHSGGKGPKLSYEAVSWCWGREKPDQLLRIHKSDRVYAFHISKNLKSALWALRKNNEVRQLWIDAICIDQKNTKERNQQVPRMDKIYGNAKSVCIWLGESDDQSKLAMEFIKNQVLSIWAFDKLIENRDMAKQWAAFITLMKRPWFSRRWVVQEIALSLSGGTLYCGKDEVPWQDFADAVSLFVEVESATHRLSDVMKRDEFFGHISDFFGDVSSLGAALLVDATSNLFRNSQTGGRQPLSTLEYLVSRLSVFEASQPRDTIYALLAISKDTTPRNIDPDITGLGTSQARKKVMAWFQNRTFVNQPYNVDYKLPVVDVYKEFIEFSIRKSDKTRALDIICRPWAPNVLKKHDDPAFMLDPTGITAQQQDESDIDSTNYTIDNKDESNVKNGSDKRETKDEKDHKDKKNKDDGDEEVPLPSWIPSLSSAAFEMEEHPIAGLRMERQNADPLVGLPGSDQRNYSAAGTKVLDVDKLKFMKWTTLKKPEAHYPDYSLFVEGFILDEVATVYQIASNGNMPYQWLKPGGWHDTDEKPPDEFWRTLVADRGPNGRNPPTYFPRACRESMKFKAKTKSRMRGNLDSKRFINEGQCTIVAEFLRRVQATIWNRVLIKTTDGRLGLARDDVRPGHKICILYGCSVPVVLQEKQKDEEEATKEQKILYDEWLQKRERVVTFFQDMWRMRMRRRAHEKAAQKKASQERKTQNTVPKTISISKTPQEPLKGLESPRKPGTWPLKTPQDSNVDKDSLVNGEPSGNKTSSAIWPICENGKSDTDEVLHDDEMASAYSSALVDQPAPEPRTEPLELSQEDSQHGKSAKLTPLKLKDAIHNDLQPLVIQQEAEKPWRDLTLPEKRELGKKKAEARQDSEFKLALTPSYYTLFGECYVHGMMNGEAIALQNEKTGKRRMPHQVFELR